MPFICHRADIFVPVYILAGSIKPNECPPPDAFAMIPNSSSVMSNAMSCTYHHSMAFAIFFHKDIRLQTSVLHLVISFCVSGINCTYYMNFPATDYFYLKVGLGDLSLYLVLSFLIMLSIPDKA